MTPLLVLTWTLLLLVAVMLGMWLAGARRRGDAHEVRCLHVLMTLLSVLAMLGLTGCPAVRPTVPKQVLVTVEKFKPLPAWATDPLVKPEPVDDTVGARLRSHEARGGVIDVANCDRRLLKKLDAGEAVDPKACGHE